MTLVTVATLTTAPIEAQVIDPVVSNNSDSDPGSLRDAISSAAADSTITFNTSLSGETIRLTTGELVVDKDLTIDASSLTEPLTISGDADMSGTPTAGDSRVFNMSSSNDVTLNGLVITNGHQPLGNGGGILAGSSLTILNSTISNNTAGGGGSVGGGIFSGGTLIIVNSTISDNHAGDFEEIHPSLMVIPFARGHGGGIMATGSVTITNTTIVGNRAGDCTKSDPDSFGGSGGGLFYRGFGGSVAIQNSTVFGNSAGDGDTAGGNGGGIFVSNDGTIAVDIPTTLNNSIIAGNFHGSGGGDERGNDIFDLNADIIPEGQNLIGDNDRVETEFPAPTTPGEPNINGDLVGTTGLPLSPQLQPLADNGGRTQTMMPFFDSIVVNAGDASALPPDTTDVNWNLNLSEPLPLDQIGNSRVSGGQLDLGAVEYQFELAPVITPAPNAALAVISALLKKIEKIEKKIKKLKKKGKDSKVKRLKKKIKKLEKRVARLGSF